MMTWLVLVAGGAAAWLLVRWLRVYLMTRSRHRLEDALKHLFEQEYRGRHATLASLAGALRISVAAVVGIVSRLQTQGLLTTRGQEFDLTPEGERLALQVIRAHRLLERYFADEARLPLRRLHAEAEWREHLLSPADADRLSAASLGSRKPARGTAGGG